MKFPLLLLSGFALITTITGVLAQVFASFQSPGSWQGAAIGSGDITIVTAESQSDSNMLTSLNGGELTQTHATRKTSRKRSPFNNGFNLENGDTLTWRSADRQPNRGTGLAELTLPWCPSRQRSVSWTGASRWWLFIAGDREWPVIPTILQQEHSSVALSL